MTGLLIIARLLSALRRPRRLAAVVEAERQYWEDVRAWTSHPANLPLPIEVTR